MSPAHADREIVDLLFFPTGGGKTEAYLGLAAFAILLRRLRDPGLTSAGVTVLMRYTLRLLTLDQLSRASTLICALEWSAAETPVTARRVAVRDRAVGREGPRLPIGWAEGRKRQTIARAKTGRFQARQRNSIADSSGELPVVWHEVGADRHSGWCRTPTNPRTFM